MELNDISGMLSSDLIEWRHQLHAHPEIAYEEEWTSDFVATKLSAWGIDVTRRIAGTGLVGSLRSGASMRAIGIRADMDALPMREAGLISYRSLSADRMHACGHDGHTAMLLGAAEYLARTRNFDGIIHFIFQPAEEGRGGARKMIEEGLFSRFRCDAVFGMHNDPLLPIGTISLKAGVVSAASTRFWIYIKGHGAHASQPHEAIDPVYIGSQIVVSLQSAISRRLDPNESGVVSVSQFHAGTTGNVLPSDATLNGTIRALSNPIHAKLKSWVADIAQGVAMAHGGNATVEFIGDVPATINADGPTREFANSAIQVLGKENVRSDLPTAMTAEDFAEFAAQVPSSFAWIGQGRASLQNVPLHHPEYDFNDSLLPIGAALWIRLAEESLKFRGETGCK